MTKGYRSNPMALQVLLLFLAHAQATIRGNEFSCESFAWQTHNAVVKCSTFGGKDRAIEVADAGSYTHAY